ncbi:hypothetical protein OPV22_033692 [Ensete ventricosum]|uniref:Uncharacterized protein n=1 Tax=Ensete ventricosum TaxID=4639 RepID=A0AAV8P125_ENSVE|nr:hypothetical protein OPV22_033692 [Ensete ventricosum]
MMVCDRIILAIIFLSTWQHANNDDPICHVSIGSLNGEAKVITTVAVPLRSHRTTPGSSPPPTEPLSPEETEERAKEFGSKVTKTNKVDTTADQLKHGWRAIAKKSNLKTVPALRSFLQHPRRCLRDLQWPMNIRFNNIQRRAKLRLDNGSLSRV